MQYHSNKSNTSIILIICNCSIETKSLNSVQLCKHCAHRGSRGGWERLIDHLLVGEICKGASKNVVFKVVVLEAGKMGMHENLNKFNKDGTTVIQQQNHRWPRLTDAFGDCRLARVV